MIGPFDRSAANLLSVLLVFGGGVSAQPVCFSKATNYNIGLNAESVVTADFNGDGILDLAGVNLEGGGSILLGKGDGSFTPGTPFNAGFWPVAVASGDFNRDGKPDLAIADNFGYNVQINLGNGDGTFQPPLSFPVGAFPVAVAVADLNRDGKPDLVVTNNVFEGGGVNILLGNGDGTFQPAMFLAVGFGPVFTAIGDFNNDGNPDLAVVNSGSSVAAGSVSVLLGKGDGTFRRPTFYQVGVRPSGVAVGDFNRDSKLDLAVTNSSVGSVTVLLGNGDGTFQTGVFYHTGSEAAYVAVADFNRDGIPDLAVANAGNGANPQSGTVTVLLGNGDGTFQLPAFFATGWVSQSIAVGDFNRDGKLDVATANRNGNDISVLINSTPCAQVP